MKASEFKKDKPYVMSTLVERDDGSVITKTGCAIYIPKRYIEKSIAQIGSENYTLGIFPIVTPDKKFLLFNAIAFVYLNPVEFNTVYIDAEEYVEFKFDPGSVVIKSLSLVQKDTLVYNVFNECISGGHIPWFVDYDDSGSLFDTASTIAGTSIGQNPEQIEILIASITRQPNNKMMCYRNLDQSIIEKGSVMPVRVPLKSVTYSAKSTTNKLAGAYFDEGISSALINPTTKPDTIGTILRK